MPLWRRRMRERIDGAVEKASGKWEALSAVCRFMCVHCVPLYIYDRYRPPLPHLFLVLHAR